MDAQVTFCDNLAQSMRLCAVELVTIVADAARLSVEKRVSQIAVTPDPMIRGTFKIAIDSNEELSYKNASQANPSTKRQSGLVTADESNQD